MKSCWENLDLKGYAILKGLSTQEHSQALNFINDQWLEVINHHNPGHPLLHDGNKLSILDYMKIESDLDHKSLWPKHRRILPASFYDWISTTSLFTSLRSLFGSFLISDEEHIGYPNFMWRLVRPNVAEDIGPLHRDSWFWEANPSFSRDPEKKYLRVWVDINTQKSLNGLLLSPASHKRNDISWEIVRKDGYNKPIMLHLPNEFKLVMPNTDPGDMIVFDDSIIHGGSLNKGTSPRISFEFTIVTSGYELKSLK